MNGNVASGHRDAAEQELEDAKMHPELEDGSDEEEEDDDDNDSDASASVDASEEDDDDDDDDEDDGLEDDGDEVGSPAPAPETIAKLTQLTDEELLRLDELLETDPAAARTFWRERFGEELEDESLTGR